ncbi:secretin N-terminal domain-containing protein [Granulicella sp. dw_53]|uniref:secretin N-terminal domain-containing protein n=1 Tax=Granulicella sp. dw_53 TaxID=2719792 RepID=UPI0031F6C830
MALALALGEPGAWAQTETATAKLSPDTVQKTFYLNNVSQQDATEVITTLRNMLDPRVKIFPVTNQNAIVLQATPDQQALAQKLLNDLDRPKKTYRLTYTVTELDSGKRIGTQHFAMIVVAGQRTVLKQGSKIPVITGTYTSGNTSSQNQATYLDVGMNFDASLEEFANGVRLRTKVEQSSVAEEKSGLGAQDPIIRQTVLEGTSVLSPGKPLILGSVDIPGSTRHLDVDVVMEQVR